MLPPYQLIGKRILYKITDMQTELKNLTSFAEDHLNLHIMV